MDFLQLEELIQSTRINERATLNLSHRNMTVLPPSVQTLTCIRCLCLNDNKLLMPPSEIISLVQLEELILSNNQLTMLPPGLGHLKHLVYLNLNQNPLGLLPSEIGELTSLESLWIVETQLTSLPDDICYLKNLRTLGAKGNKIGILPESFHKLSSLKWCHLGSNKLAVLPTSFGALPSISYLNLDLNEFEKIPRCLCDIESLTSLSMKENSIREVDDEMLIGLANIYRLDIRDNPFCEKPAHWKGMDHILVGKTGLENCTTECPGDGPWADTAPFEDSSSDEGESGDSDTKDEK